MARLLRPRGEVQKAIDAHIRAGDDLQAKAEIAERTGGYSDWLLLLATWREDTLADLDPLYEGVEIGQEFAAVTEASKHLTGPPSSVHLL